MHRLNDTSEFIVFLKTRLLLRHSRLKCRNAGAVDNINLHPAWTRHPRGPDGAFSKSDNIGQALAETSGIESLFQDRPVNYKSHQNQRKYNIGSE